MTTASRPRRLLVAAAAVLAAALVATAATPAAASTPTTPATPTTTPDKVEYIGVYTDGSEPLDVPPVGEAMSPEQLRKLDALILAQGGVPIENR